MPPFFLLNINMNDFLDKVTSNFSVGIFYLGSIILWNYVCTNLVYLNPLIFYFYPPFGIIILGILFFGNKIIPSLIITDILFLHLSIYFFDKNIFDKSYITIFIFAFCVPVTISILKKLGVSIGMGNNFKLDKSNIFHVFILTFMSSVSYLIITVILQHIFNYSTNSDKYFIGNILGGISFILLIKILINIPFQLTKLSNK